MGVGAEGGGEGRVSACADPIGFDIGISVCGRLGMTVLFVLIPTGQA